MFVPGPDQREFRDVVRALCADKVEPNAEAADRTERFPQASWQALADAGVCGVPLPAEHGGGSADLVTWSMVVEEVARACAATAVTLLVHTGVATMIARHGSEREQREWLPQAVTGGIVLGYAQSEAHAGSDVAAISTRAEADGDAWRITGVKSWITSAGIAGAYLVLARTEPDRGTRGMTMFVVPADADGLSIAKTESKMGLRGSPTGEIVLDGVRVGADAVVGERGGAFGLAMSFLDRSRPMVGAQAIGVAAAAFGVARDYVRERDAFGRKVADFQGVQFMLADMAIGIETARGMVRRAAAIVDAGGVDGEPEPTVAAAIAKAHATDVAMAVTTDAVQLLGGAGYVTDFAVERHMRDAKVFQIYEGTNQIQRWIVGRRLLGR